MTAYEGYLAFGGNEVINNARAIGYTRTAGCPTHMLKVDCPNLWDALGEAAPYGYAEIAAAPWYDPAKPELSARFLGAYALRIDDVYDSTRRAEMVTTIGDGGVLGRSTKGPKEARVTALLIADGRDALEYATNWLSSVLDADTCGQHASSCGVSDLAFFADCPPARGARRSDASLDEFNQTGDLFTPLGNGIFSPVSPLGDADGDGTYEVGLAPYTDDEYESLQIRPLRRYLHDVGAISGPTERSLSKFGRFWVKEVEFVLASERGYVYSATRTLDLPVTASSILQDAPFNLAPYPSAELAGFTITVATNYSANPSLEVDAEGWSGSTGVVTGSAVTGMTSHGRVTGELAASGTASYRSRLVGGSGSGRAAHTIVQDIDVSAILPTSSVSLTIWAALTTTGNGAAPVSLRADVDWRDSSGNVISTTAVDVTTEYAGGPIARRAMRKPSGAVVARVKARGEFDWATGSDARLYVDALALTVP